MAVPEPPTIPWLDTDSTRNCGLAPCVNTGWLRQPVCLYSDQAQIGTRVNNPFAPGLGMRHFNLQ